MHAMRQPANTERKGSCADHGFCTATEQRDAYASVLERLRAESVFDKLMPDARGGLYINVPFAGKFEEREILVQFLRREVLNRRPEVRFIRIFVTDVQDFYSGQVMPSYDPQIFICYAVQDGRSPLPWAQLTLGMHPDCSSRFLTDFGELYQLYYFLWQKILYNNFASSGQIAVFCNLWLEEAIEVQNVAKQAGMIPSAALKNAIYYGETLTAPLTGNKRDRRPFHYITIAERLPLKVVPKIVTGDEDYTGPYHNMWTLEQRAKEVAKLRGELGVRDTDCDSESLSSCTDSDSE